MDQLLRFLSEFTKKKKMENTFWKTQNTKYFKQTNLKSEIKITYCGK